MWRRPLRKISALPCSKEGEAGRDRSFSDTAFVELDGVHHEALELRFDLFRKRLDLAGIDDSGGARDDVRALVGQVFRELFVKLRVSGASRSSASRESFASSERLGGIYLWAPSARLASTQIGLSFRQATNF